VPITFKLIFKGKKMKLKLLVASALLASSSVVLAQTSATISLQDRTLDSNKQTVSVTQLQVRTRLIDNLDGDVSMNEAKNNTTNSVTLRKELGLVTGYNLTDFAKVTLRAATGIKDVSGKEGIYYYSVEPGLNIKTPVDGLTARVAYRYRNAYDTANLDELQTMRYALSYDLTKKDRITLQYDNAFSGTTTYKQTGIAYTRSF
jgi:hypothetical protein